MSNIKIYKNTFHIKIPEEKLLRMDFVDTYLKKMTNTTKILLVHKLKMQLYPVQIMTCCRT